MNNFNSGNPIVEDQFTASANWAEAYPNARVGVLVLTGVSNPASHPVLEGAKGCLEADLRKEFGEIDRQGMKAHPILSAYQAYYKRFKKTYHVQHQLETVVHKGGSIPKVAALVEAMFMAELKNLLLTAGHDMDIVQPPVRIDVGTGEETYTRMNGQEQVVKAGDMFIADEEGVLSCILYGPDRRTRISPETTRTLFTVYAPEGIGEEMVRRHLEGIYENVLLFAADARVEMLEVFGASAGE
jgi:DNA/RNA-binding domain of Phe-tRNA-synthetase-like protein